MLLITRVTKGLFALLLLCVTEETRDGKPVHHKADSGAALEDYIILANGYLQQQNREKALQAIKKGLAIDEDSPGLLNSLAFYYAGDEEYVLAEKEFQKAISADKSYMPSYLNYGSFLYSQKRYPEACEMFEKASSDPLYGKRSAAFSNWGVCLKQVGKRKEAAVALNRALNSDSRNYNALLERAKLLFDEGEFEDSRRDYEEFVKYAEQTAGSLWLGIRLMSVFHDADKQASYALYLKNTFPASPEYREYKAWVASH
jgi:type IV pilus assembly protein PilF